jgi:putative oxidoreductase
VFVWFGVLKLIGDSPVKAMIAATLPWINPDIGVPTLGVIEIALGIALVARKLVRVTLLVLAGHLSGTFLTFLVAPDLMMQHGNPLLLTADGEFVVENLVLISAAFVLLARTVAEDPWAPAG